MACAQARTGSVSQAMKGENGEDSAAPSVTDPGNQEQDPAASILEAMGEIASGRVDAAAAVKPEVGS